MNFDLDNSSGEWFPFFASEVGTDGKITYSEPEPGAGKVCLRMADADTMAKIHAQTRIKKVEYVLNTQTKKMERIEYETQTPEQEKKEREMLWDFVIVDWEKTKFFDRNGAEILCTPANKVKMMAIPVFARFISRCLEVFGRAAVEAKEVAEKNS